MSSILAEIKKGILYGLGAGIIAFNYISGCNDTIGAEDNPDKPRIAVNQCSDGLYDNNTSCAETLEDILGSVEAGTYKLHTLVKYRVEGGKSSGRREYAWNSSCVLLESGYILAAGHAVSNERLEELLEENAGGAVTELEMAFSININNESYPVNPVWTGDVWRNNEDFAILAFEAKPELSLPYFQFEAGNPEELEKGNITYTFTAINEPHRKEGHVSSPNRGIYNNYFNETTNIIRGDSGGPVIAFRDGVPELVGIIVRKNGDVLKANTITR